MFLVQSESFWASDIPIFLDLIIYVSNGEGVFFLPGVLLVGLVGTQVE